MKKFFFLSVSFLVFQSAYALNAAREVKAGELYRSNQLSPSELESTVSRHGIKTVINLRGFNPNEDWWKDEKEILEKLKVNFINISMSAKSLPSRENLIALLDAFKNAPRPLLIHCQAGVDRTGEAVAVYQITQWNVPKEEARRSLFPSLQRAKYYFIDHVFQGMDWAYESYFPCQSDYDYYDKGHCPQP